MIPILYPENETDFVSNGIGGLSCATSCTVTEERNGSYELTMVYPVAGWHFKEIRYKRYIMAVPADGEKPQPFEIYSISKPISGKVTIKARHISYQLSYIVTLPGEKEKTAETALQSLGDLATTDCPFDFSSDIIAKGTFQNSTPQSIRALLGGQAGSILDVFGGEYLFDGYKVKLLKNRGSTIPVSLEYGKNIIDLQQEENIASTYTAVIAFWKNQTTTGEVKTVYGDLIKSANADNFPYVRTMALDVSTEYKTPPTKEQLTKRAETYVRANKIGVPKVSVKVSFVALWQTEEYKNIEPLQRIHLCDTIKVVFRDLGIDSHAKVTKTTYNVLKDRYDSIEIGDSRTNLIDTIASQTTAIKTEKKERSEWLWDATRRATEIIQGGLGGYVVIRPDEKTGYPEEILIMDQPDKDTAKNVIRMNKNGIGFSEGNGYKGPFQSAWTIDGTFNADFINSGIIKADLIRAGILKAKDEESGNYWNLETGEFQLTQKVKVGESTIASAKDVTTAARNAEKNAIDAASEKVQKLDESLSQKEVFNRLTNDGTAKGVYLQDQDLFINASYIKTGELEASLIKSGKIASADNSLVFDLDSGLLTAKKLSINSENFQLAENGTVTATNATISGTFKAGGLTFGGSGIYGDKGGFITVDGYSMYLGGTWSQCNTYLNGDKIYIGGTGTGIKLGSDNIMVGSQSGKNGSISFNDGYDLVTGQVVTGVTKSTKNVVQSISMENMYAFTTFTLERVKIPNGATFNKYSNTVTLSYPYKDYYVFSAYSYKQMKGITSTTEAAVVSDVTATTKTVTKRTDKVVQFAGGLCTS
ncbi:phage tail spike protein [Bacillota bacterium HCP3S3_E9]